VIENYPEGRIEEIETPFFPDDPQREGMGFRKVPFGRTLLIERDDFVEVPPKKFTRLSPGKEVRLRKAYVLKCVGVVKDDAGEVCELRCTIDLDAGFDAPRDGRKVGNAIHWVSAEHSVPVTLRLYDRLFNHPNPGGGGRNFRDAINPASLEVLDQARAEPAVGGLHPGDRCQFERRGFYYVDPKDSRPGALVLNRIVPLRDSWAKIAKGK
jgi:glutaminyl-tRNA synthetase